MLACAHLEVLRVALVHPSNWISTIIIFISTAKNSCQRRRLNFTWKRLMWLRTRLTQLSSPLRTSWVALRSKSRPRQRRSTSRCGRSISPRCRLSASRARWLSSISRYKPCVTCPFLRSCPETHLKSTKLRRYHLSTIRLHRQCLSKIAQKNSALLERSIWSTASHRKALGARKTRVCREDRSTIELVETETWISASRRT